MAEKSYYIEQQMGSVVGYLVECPKCKRKTLVEMALFGVPHHYGVNVTCAECVEIKDDFRQDYPEIVKQIEDWINEGEEEKEKEEGKEPESDV